MTGVTIGKPAPDGWGAGGYIRFGIFCVALLAGGLGGWAATAKLKGAVISSGHLRVESQRQVVQHLDGGIVGEILVREGDLVGAGEVLKKRTRNYPQLVGNKQPAATPTTATGDKA